MDKGVDMIKLTIYVYNIVTRKNKIIFKITYEAQQLKPPRCSL